MLRKPQPSRIQNEYRRFVTLSCPVEDIVDTFAVSSGVETVGGAITGETSRVTSVARLLEERH